MLDNSIQVKTDQFDGPLSLLLLLIKKEEMSIKTLNLSQITKQYLSFINKMKDTNFDLVGEYLYLAATLLLLKSKSCLDEEDLTELKERFSLEPENKISSTEDLIQRLQELEHHQKLGNKLWELPKLGYQIFTKPKFSRKLIVDSVLTPIDLKELTGALIDLYKREKRKYSVVRRDRLSIKEKLVFLKSYLKPNTEYELSDLINAGGGASLDNTVMTFISLLEMARMRKLSIRQEDSYSKIFISNVSALDDFNVDLANGFDSDQSNTSDNASPNQNEGQSEEQKFDADLLNLPGADLEQTNLIQ